MLLNICQTYLHNKKTQLLKVKWVNLENVVKKTYLSEIQTNKKWYWEQEQHHQNLIAPKKKIFHPWPDSTVVKNIADIPKNVCAMKKGTKSLQRRPLFISDEYHDGILDKIMRRYQIEYKISIYVDYNM